MASLRPILFVLFVFFVTPTWLKAEERVRFNRDIRPFLSDTCFHCHGPDSKTREAGLRLDDGSSVNLDLGGYMAIASGDPDKSEALRRVLSDDPNEQMPPPDSGHKWTDDQKSLFRQWIKEGAVYEKHWAFTPIERTSTVSGSVDEFIKPALIKAGLQPSPLATAETQLRRVSLDLTGLPPTIDEIDRFLKEIETRGLETAYRRAVDRLLKSPRYGERMAWQWMEAARYADTDGYQNDGPRDMWRWRDWVIDAFNSNMPFDQFTIEQLAGDLLQNPTHEQLIATAFNRNNRYNSEEGIPIDEFLLENAIDRVDTTATVWMGLTAGCARCHDHKFDPISQVEYYQLVDYFNDVAESGRAVKFGNSEPWIKTPTQEQLAQWKTLEQAVEKAKEAILQKEPEIATAQAAWEKQLSQDTIAIKNGLDHHFTFDENDERLVASQGNPILDTGRFGNAATLHGADSFELGKIEGLIGNGRFSIAFWMNPATVDDGPVLSNEAAGTGRQGILVEFVNGRLRWNINTRWISGVSTIETINPLKPGEWVHVTLTNDGTQRARGMTLYLNGQAQPVEVIRNTNSNLAERKDNAAMHIGYSKHVGFWKGQVDELRFYSKRTLSSEEAAMLAVSDTISSIVSKPEADRSKWEKYLLRTAFLESGASDEFAKLLREKQRAESALVAYEDKIPTTMIMEDIPEGRPSYVRVRGVYDNLGEEVFADVPAALPPFPKGIKNDRLAFAKWLVHPDHPLTARVIANRYWQLFFGRGLVLTTEDFGSQGQLPTHPELLDWLAAELIDSGWDTQALIKSIVFSHTYRQSSAVTDEHLTKDPNNTFLARAPRLRLTGNVLRDQALAASGLLIEKLGGPSVFPYQPAKLWEEASNAKYVQGKGEDLYRRSLYTYWKRTLAPPMMAVLDSSDRESCAVRPRSTNTPLQALTLMNDVTFVESARKFAERILKDGGTTDEECINFAFRVVAARLPTQQERGVLQDALNAYRHELNTRPESAAGIQRVGEIPTNVDATPVELAATTALANVLLNLEEVTTRE
jgi:hypothetical protein